MPPRSSSRDQRAWTEFRVAEYKRARRRSLAFFRRHLTAAQLRQYREKKIIRVRGSDGGNYTIDCRKIIGNIRSAKLRRRYCLVIEYRSAALTFTGILPRGDHLLAQKFILETNERQFLSTASRVPWVMAWERVPLRLRYGAPW